MKQRFSIVLVVLSLLVALVGVAAAPMAGRSVRLVGVQFVPQKGPVFTFEVSGNFSRSALKGTVHVQGGGNYPLYCTKVDDTTVKCNTSQKVGAENVSVTFGGSTFWTYVPGAPAPVEYCYFIYDMDTEYVWKTYGGHCQDKPVKYHDMVTYYNADWGFEEEVYFLPEGPICSGITGDAYYYPLCY